MPHNSAPVDEIRLELDGFKLPPEREMLGRVYLEQNKPANLSSIYLNVSRIIAVTPESARIQVVSLLLLKVKQSAM